jgi:uncharacterized protein (UPF0332 family)
MENESLSFFNKALESIEDSKIAIENERYSMSVNYICAVTRTNR